MSECRCEICGSGDVSISVKDTSYGPGGSYAEYDRTTCRCCGGCVRRMDDGTPIGEVAEIIDLLKASGWVRVENIKSAPK